MSFPNRNQNQYTSDDKNINENHQYPSYQQHYQRNRGYNQSSLHYGPYQHSRFNRNYDNYNNHFDAYDTYHQSSASSSHSGHSAYLPPYRRSFHHQKYIEEKPEPFKGSEEYTQKRIQETSDIIKKQLMNPETIKIAKEEKMNRKQSESDSDDNANEAFGLKIKKEKIKDNLERPLKKPKLEDNIKREEKKDKPKESILKNKYNVEDICDKIINHITNLSHRRKKNLICSSSTGYDTAIQEIQKQKRLELSKALREMCSNKIPENSINSIIPDFDIRIEDFPIDIIKQLSSQFDLDVNPMESEHKSNNETNRSQHDYLFDQSQNSSTSYSQNDLESMEDVKPSIKAEENFESLLHFEKPFPQIRVKQEIVDISDNCSEGNLDNDDLLNILNEGNKKPEEEEEIDVVKGEFSNDVLQIYNNPEIKKELINYHSSNEQDIDTSWSQSIKIKVEKGEENQVNNKNTENNNAIQNEETSTSAISLQKIKKEKDASSSMSQLNTLNANKGINENDTNNSNATLTTENRMDVVEGSVVVKQERNESSVCSQQNAESVQQPLNVSQQNILQLETMSDGVKLMYKIDEELNRLTKLRQLLFKRIVEGDLKSEGKFKSPGIDGDIGLLDTSSRLDLQQIPEKIVVMKRIRNILLIGTARGKVHYVNLATGKIEETINVVYLPITWILDVRINAALHFIVGSLDKCFKICHFENKCVVNNIEIDKGSTCIDMKWDYIFIGCDNGKLFRYSINKGKVEHQDKIANKICALKATQEGARKILIVAAHSQTLSIRDAISGLFLRNIGRYPQTVFSMVMEKQLIYCGTINQGVIVYSFYDGGLVEKLISGNRPVSCLKVVKNLLFASSYNGKVYIYNLKDHKCLGSITGPGGGILCMEVYDNLVFVGTDKTLFQSLEIPENILKHKS